MKKVLWSNDVTEMCQEIVKNEDSHLFGEDPESMEVYSYALELNMNYLEDLINELRYTGENNGFIIKGDYGLWNGRTFGASYSESIELSDAIKKVVYSDSELQSIYIEDGRLLLTLSHHDGTNHFEILSFTDESNEDPTEWLQDMFYELELNQIKEQIEKHTINIGDNIIENY